MRQRTRTTESGQDFPLDGPPLLAIGRPWSSTTMRERACEQRSRYCLSSAFRSSLSLRRRPAALTPSRSRSMKRLSRAAAGLSNRNAPYVLSKTARGVAADSRLRVVVALRTRILGRFKPPGRVRTMVLAARSVRVTKKPRSKHLQPSQSATAKTLRLAASLAMKAHARVSARSLDGCSQSARCRRNARSANVYDGRRRPSADLCAMPVWPAMV